MTNTPKTSPATQARTAVIHGEGDRHGLFTESLMASITQAAPDAKERVLAFLEGRAAKVQKT